jgi:hypothetical protein
MTRIADALGVSKSQIANDLAGFPVTGKPPDRPKGGRPKKEAPTLDKARERTNNRPKPRTCGLIA